MSGFPLDQAELDYRKSEGEDVTFIPWSIPPIAEGTTVIVAGRNEPGDASFSGQEGIMHCSEFDSALGNTYCVMFGETLEKNILPAMVSIVS